MTRSVADLNAAEDEFHSSLAKLQSANQAIAISEEASLSASEKFNADKLAKDEALAATRAALAEVTAIVDELYGPANASPEENATAAQPAPDVR